MTYYLRDKNGLIDNSEGEYTSAYRVVEHAKQQDLKLREDVHITDELGNRIASLHLERMENTSRTFLYSESHHEVKTLEIHDDKFRAELEEERAKLEPKRQRYSLRDELGTLGFIDDSPAMAYKALDDYAAMRRATASAEGEPLDSEERLAWLEDSDGNTVAEASMATTTILDNGFQESVKQELGDLYEGAELADSSAVDKATSHQAAEEADEWQPPTDDLARQVLLFRLQNDLGRLNRLFNLDGNHPRAQAVLQHRSEQGEGAVDTDDVSTPQERQTATLDSRDPKDHAHVSLDVHTQSLDADTLENIAKNFTLGDPQQPMDEVLQESEQQELTRREFYGLDNIYTLKSFNEDGLEKSESFSEHGKGFHMLARETDERATLTDRNNNLVAWKEWEGGKLKTKCDRAHAEADMEKTITALNAYAEDAGIELGKDELPKGGFRAYLDAKHPEGEQQKQQREESAKLQTVLQQGHNHTHQFRG